MRWLAPLLLIAGLPAPVLAQSAAGVAQHDVGPGDVGKADPLRRILLDALRPAIERDLGQPVQFVVVTLRRQGNWAFAALVPQTRRGTSIDFARTRHGEALREGMFEREGTIHALLQRRGKGWIVKDYAIGATDVAYAAWPESHGAPYALFGLSAP